MESPSSTYIPIAQEIARMADEDQKMRQKWQAGQPHDPDLDQRNTQRLKQVVAKIGWPTISKVGRDASQKAWLLVQHADHDAAFQKECLALMKRAAVGDVSPSNIAYLEDRIATHENQPQLYGTQFRTNDEGLLEPFPIREPEKLDERRRAMSLEPFAEYQKWADGENAKRR